MGDDFSSEQPTQPIAYESLADVARQWRLQLASSQPTPAQRGADASVTVRMEVVK